jgi:hypothetical protein
MGIFGTIAKKAPVVLNRVGIKVVKKKTKQEVIKRAKAAAKVLAAKARVDYRAGNIAATRGINPNAVIPMPTIVKNVKPVAKKAVKTLNQKIATGLKVLGGIGGIGGIAGLIGKKKKKKRNKYILLVNVWYNRRFSKICI